MEKIHASKNAAINRDGKPVSKSSVHAHNDREQQYKIGYNATSWSRIRGKKLVLRSNLSPKGAAAEVSRRLLGEDATVD